MIDLAMHRTAVISECGKYRYSLTRRWGAEDSRSVLWIMLNPSTADAETDDRTISKCVKYSIREGYGQMTVVNLYAYRSTDPSVLWSLGADEARGPENVDHIFHAACRAGGAVAAWGLPGGPKRPSVLSWANRSVPFKCLGVCKDGSPRHPLYLRDDAPFVEWEPKP